jgi:hypothetical protein
MGHTSPILGPGHVDTGWPSRSRISRSNSPPSVATSTKTRLPLSSSMTTSLHVEAAPRAPRRIGAFVTFRRATRQPTYPCSASDGSPVEEIACGTRSHPQARGPLSSSAETMRAQRFGDFCGPRDRARPGPGPAGQPQWLPDPAHRYERRFWDGTSWTSQAVNGRMLFDDPI